MGSLAFRWDGSSGPMKDMGKRLVVWSTMFCRWYLAFFGTPAGANIRAATTLRHQPLPPQNARYLEFPSHSIYLPYNLVSKFKLKQLRWGRHQLTTSNIGSFLKVNRSQNNYNIKVYSTQSHSHISLYFKFTDMRLPVWRTSRTWLSADVNQQQLEDRT